MQKRIRTLKLLNTFITIKILSVDVKFTEVSYNFNILLYKSTCLYIYIYGVPSLKFPVGNVTLCSIKVFGLRPTILE